MRGSEGEIESAIGGQGDIGVVLRNETLHFP